VLKMDNRNEEVSVLKLIPVFLSISIPPESGSPDVGR